MLVGPPSNCNHEFLDEYANRGWSLFPILPMSKKPATEHGFYDARQNPADIASLFSGKPDANIGIATGKPSGIWVLDVDDFDANQALERMQRQHGKLETLTARTGSGWHHYYFRLTEDVDCHTGTVIDGVKYRLDVKGNGGYVVAPPSVTESGKYDWQHETTIAEAPSWLLSLVNPRTAAAEDQALSTYDLCKHSENRTENDMDRLIGEAIHFTMPSRCGTRNESVFAFVGRLLAFLPRTADNATLKVLAKRWHDAALLDGVMRTRSFDTTWSDFVRGWTTRKHPAGLAIDSILQQAKEGPLCKEALAYDDHATQRLVCLCKLLQNFHGTQPLYLSCRMAAKVMDVSHVTANRTMLMLAFDGILTLVRRGEQRAGGKAAYYRFGVNQGGTTPF